MSDDGDGNIGDNPLLRSSTPSVEENNNNNGDTLNPSSLTDDHRKTSSASFLNERAGDGSGGVQFMDNPSGDPTAQRPSTNTNRSMGPWTPNALNLNDSKHLPNLDPSAASSNDKASPKPFAIPHGIPSHSRKTPKQAQKKPATAILPPIRKGTSKAVVKPKEYDILRGNIRTPRASMSREGMYPDVMPCAMMNEHVVVTRKPMVTRKRTKDKYEEVPHVLDGFFLLNKAPAEDPDDVYVLDASNQQLKYVIEDDLSLFTKLHTLRAGENALPMARLGALPGLRSLHLPFNKIRHLDLEIEGRFPILEYLDLSYNHVSEATLIVLATLPKLKHLEVTSNKIKNLPLDLLDMSRWRDRVIELILPTQVAMLDAFVRGDMEEEQGAGVNVVEEKVVEEAGRKSIEGTEATEEGEVIALEIVDTGDFAKVQTKEVESEQPGKESPERRYLVPNPVLAQMESENGSVSSQVNRASSFHPSSASTSNHSPPNNAATDASPGRPSPHQNSSQPESIAMSVNDKAGPSPSTTVGGSLWKVEQMVVAFERLENMNLENNWLESAESMFVLGTLPSLRILNISSNRFRTFEFLAPPPISTSAPSTPRTPLPGEDKYDGFKKLEELNISNNFVDTPAGLMGIVWLPALRRVMIDGNPIVKKRGGVIGIRGKEDVGDDVLGYFDFNPLDILPNLYAIQIADLSFHQKLPLLQDTYYALAPTDQGPSLRRVQKPHLRHKVHDDLQAITAKRREEGTRRRDVTMTEEDVRATVRAGRILTLKERKMARRESEREERKERERKERIIAIGEALERQRRLEMEAGDEVLESGTEVLEEVKDVQKRASEEPVINVVEAVEVVEEKNGSKQTSKSSLTFDPKAVDNTFITSVHITSGNLDDDDDYTVDEDDVSTSDEDATPSDASPPQDSDTDTESTFSDDDVTLRNAKIRKATYSLDHYNNLVLEESYAKPTFASTRRAKEEEGEDEDAVKLKPEPSGFVSPANTMWTTYAAQAAVEREAEVKRREEEEAKRVREKASKVKGISRRGRDGEGERVTIVENDVVVPMDAVALAEKRVEEYRRRAGRKGRRGGAGRDEFGELKKMMAKVDQKIILIEANLDTILKSDALQRHIPNSSRLFEDVKDEYTRIEQRYTDAAEKRLAYLNKPF
ncbi:hypothetical protein BC829DRAFT_473664 [Chytridium lagenaria]|nr:hypothetical protein BC829DRAFT_473664 [Chytridium lagenaria]